ncbi:MAG: hypothetical protein NC132_06860 [Corallococcus sp.]|nr:hypothetical protein [Corallococcus sp.]
MKLDLIMLILTVVPLVFGLLFGLLRGSRRSILRIILVIICVVAAFFLKDMVTERLLALEIEGKTIVDMIVEALPQESASLSDTIIPILKTVINVVAFLIVFLLLQFVTWAILFPILKIFVKKGEKKHALVGGIIGAVQGVAIAFVLCVVMNGLFVSFAKVGEIEASLSDVSQTPAMVMYADGDAESGSATSSPEDFSLDMFIEYKDSGICNFYSKIGDGAFNLIARTKNEDKTVTLKGQLDALVGVADMAKEMSAIQNIDFENGIKGSAEDIKNIFDKLDEINKGLTDESKETINALVQSVADGFDLPVDVSVIDFTTVDFAKEGEIITSLADYGDIDPSTLTVNDAKEIVNKVVESDLILPLLESNDELDLKLPEEQKAEAKKEIERLQAEGVDEKKINSLMNIFGLEDTSSQN